MNLACMNDYIYNPYTGITTRFDGQLKRAFETVQRESAIDAQGIPKIHPSLVTVSGGQMLVCLVY
jgi:hypothetical protein